MIEMCWQTERTTLPDANKHMSPTQLAFPINLSMSPSIKQRARCILEARENAWASMKEKDGEIMSIARG